MKLHFLGTGAADWNGPDERGEYRRLTSTLIDDSLLIDYTKTASDMMPADSTVTHILITHSHSDHLYPAELEMRHGFFAHDMRADVLKVRCGTGAYEKIKEWSGEEFCVQADLIAPFACKFPIFFKMHA